MQAGKEWSMFEYLETPHDHHMVSPEPAQGWSIQISYVDKGCLELLSDLQTLVANHICLCATAPRSCDKQQDSYFCDDREVGGIIRHNFKDAVD